MKEENLKTIKKEDVRKGMYVILPLAWHQHPFIKNQFVVMSDDDIEKIGKLNLRELQVDPARYQRLEDHDAAQGSRRHDGKESETARKIVPDSLITALHDTQSPPERKAAAIRQESISMMENLLENPSAENIREAKKGISEIVHLILREEDTLHYLLNITSHDFYTYTHSVSVGILGVALAKSLFQDSRNHDIHALGAGFFLHDLGKVGISNEIINKPGRLDDKEMQEIRRHPALGFKILNDTKQLTEQSKIIVLQHHERFDGTGYPKGLRSRDIHVYARICSIADVYEALTSDRPYRKKMAPFAALKLMREEMMHHFEKDLFEKFVMLFKAPASLSA